MKSVVILIWILVSLSVLLTIGVVAAKSRQTQRRCLIGAAIIFGLVVITSGAALVTG
jgi:hypothetical protein